MGCICCPYCCLFSVTVTTAAAIAVVVVVDDDNDDGIVHVRFFTLLFGPEGHFFAYKH